MGLSTDKGHGALGIGYSFLASAAHHWVKSAGAHLGLLEQDAWHGTHWELRICIQHGHCMDGFIAWIWEHCITLDTLG